MKFRIKKTTLVHGITQVIKAVSQKTTIPVLTGIKIDLTDEGLYLTGSNSDITIQMYIPNQKNDEDQIWITELGSIVLPGKILNDIVRKLPDDTLEWELDQNHKVKIKSNQAVFELIGLDADDFPTLPHISAQESFTIHSNLLSTMIHQTRFAVSHDEAKMVLTGVLWQLQSGSLMCIGTDGHRLARRIAKIDVDDTVALNNIIVPGKSMTELAKTIADIDGYVDVFVADNQLLIKTDQIRFYSRLIEGKYPETSDFIPKDSEIKVICSSKKLLESVDRALLIGRGGHDHVIKWIIDGQNVIITSTSQEIGKVEEQLHAEIEGSNLSIAFNPRYMIDALRSIDSDEVLIQFKGAMAPFTIQSKEHQDTLYLILPIRTH